MFTNPYDAQLAQQEADRKVAVDAANIPWYRQGAYEGTMIGQTAGRALGGMLGLQTPEQAKQGKIEEVMGQYPEGAKSYEDLMSIADSFRNAGMLDLWKETYDMAQDQKSSLTSSQQQKQSNLLNTLAFLQQNKGVNLTDSEKEYFMARAKDAVSVTMQGQVIDTAPNLFDQIVAARGKDQAAKDGIGDTGITQANRNAAVSKLSEKIVKADLSDLDTALNEAENMFAKYGDKDVPGLSELNILERQTKEGSDNSGRVKGVFNILAKLRSGAAITESEAERFTQEISSAKVVTDEMWKDWIDRIRTLVENKKQEIFAGEREDVKEQYWKQGGSPLKIRTIESGVSSQTPEQDALLQKYGINK